MASSAPGTASKPASTVVLANQPTAQTPIYGAAATTVSLAPTSIGSAGSSQPHENRQPFNTVNYIISTVGIYPSQS
jgi:microcystin-dependent protein